LSDATFAAREPQLILPSAPRCGRGGRPDRALYYEKVDLSRVLDEISGPGPILLLGTSLGAAVALQTAAEDNRVAVVVAVATFSDLRTVASERAPFFASKGNIDSYNFDHRSLVYNLELVVNALDRQCNEALAATLLEDMASGTEIRWEQFNRRPLLERMLERLAYGLRHWL
jgi:pimeloyl-ACP methyl ester carboxylesterase